MPTSIIRFLGLTLLLAALESQALTLGRMRGAALIGQGLDVTIQVQTDPGEGPSSLCFEAEVFHADARQDPSRVQVNAEPTQTPQTFNVRIQSSIVVDEPVVTIYLRAGCTQKISRRYVMLADIVSEPQAAVVVQAPQVPLVAVPSGAAGAGATSASIAQAVPDSARAAAPRGSAGARSPAPAKPARVAAPRKPAPVKAVAPSPAPAAQTSEKLVAGRAAGQSRLKLDPLEVLSERVATLESSTASAPAEQAAREARDAQRLQTLEASVKNLLAVATRNETNLADLRTRLQQAEADRYGNPLVYVLVALLVACLAGIAFLLTRRGGTGATVGNWWSGTTHAQNTVSAADIPTSGARRSGFTPVSAPAPLSAPDSLPAAEPAPQQQAPQGRPPSKAAPVTQVDVSLVEMSESTFDRLMQSGTTHSAVRKSPPPSDHGQPGLAPPRRLLNTDELFDIRQQAEFFVSLGQTDQAVRILENRISESGETSPLAYLDLLKIFHSLGLKADFRQVREDFNLLFNARVPEFASFANEGRDLDAYPEIVQSLVQAWGKPEILPTIEALVFRDQWTSHHELLDLAVFRDLLLLHAVAQMAATLPDQLQVAAGRNIPRSPFSNAAKPVVQTAASLVQPLSVSEPLAAEDVPLPPLAGTTEVDIDLTDLSLDFDLDPPPTFAGPPPVASNPDPGNLIDFDLPKLPGDDGGSRHGA